MREPAGLLERPHHGGFPVPYVTAWVDGRPDFKVHDEVARATCATEGLCQLCGIAFELDWVRMGTTANYRELAFVGNIRSVMSRTFGEPPAHPDCLAYAWQVCPWLAGRGWAKGWEEKAREAGIKVIAPTKPPEQMGILVTDRFWLIEDDEGATDFKYLAGDPIRPIEWRNRG